MSCVADAGYAFVSCSSLSFAKCFVSASAEYSLCSPQGVDVEQKTMVQDINFLWNGKMMYGVGTGGREGRDGRKGTRHYSRNCSKNCGFHKEIDILGTFC